MKDLLKLLFLPEIWPPKFFSSHLAAEGCFFLSGPLSAINLFPKEFIFPVDKRKATPQTKKETSLTLVLQTKL